MKMLVWAALVLTSFCAGAISLPASAQITGTPMSCPRVDQSSIPCTPAVIVDPVTGVPIAPGSVTASTSTALENTPAVGTTILGPFTPQLGRDLRLVIRGTGWAGTIAVGTSKTTEACSTFNPITVAGQTWASFTADANEVVDTPTLDGIVYCVREVITTAGATVTVRQ